LLTDGFDVTIFDALVRAFHLDHSAAADQSRQPRFLARSLALVSRA